MKISASDIQQFLRCRQAWDWGSESAHTRHWESTSPMPQALWLGTGVHRALECFYRPPHPPLLETFTDWAAQSILEQKRDCPDFIDGMYDASFQLGAAMLDGYAGEYGANPHDDKDGIRVLCTEQQFSIPIPGTANDYHEVGFLVGTLDGLVLDSNGKLWVIDHKTFSQPPRNPATNLQFLLYVWAVRVLLASGHPDLEALGISPNTECSGLLYNGLRKQTPGPRVSSPLFSRQYIRYTEDETQFIEHQLRAYYAAMAERNVYLTLGDHCNWCPFASPCSVLQLNGDHADVLRSHYRLTSARDGVYRDVE